MKRFGRLVLGGMFVVSMSLSPGAGLAQTANGDTVVFKSVPTSPELATELEVEAEDLGVEEPNFFSNFRRVLARFFTRNQVKRAKIDLEMANLTLLRARQALNRGDETRAQELLDRYNTQIAGVSDRLLALVDQFGKTDPAVAALLDQATAANVLQAATLDNLSLKATREFNKKILQIRIQTMKHLAEILLKEKMTPEELAKKVAELSRELAKKESKAQEKFVRRLALGEELDEISDNDELEGAIEEHEAEVEDEIADLDEEEMEDVAEEIVDELDHHLVVLQSLLDKVPETARPAIQRVLDRQLAAIKEDAAKDPKVLTKLLLKSNERQAERLKKIIERLKETLKDDEDAKKELEEQEKEIEELREAEKQRIEEEREGSNSGSESESEGESEDEDNSGSGSGS